VWPEAERKLDSSATGAYQVIVDRRPAVLE
jgi:hypothetical protein